MRRLALLTLLVSSPLVAQPSFRDSRCELDRGRSRTSSHTRIHRLDESDRSIEMTISTGDRCLDARLIGAMTFSDDDRDIVSMTDDALATFRERRDGSDRAVRYSSSNGRVERRAWRQGREVAFDDDMRQWIGELLPELLRETGIDAKRRVTRLHQREGTPGVLDLVGRIRSSGSRSAHYAALLEQPRLSDGDLEAVVRHAARVHRASSGDYASLLTRIPLERLRSASARDAIAIAIPQIASSGDRTETLRRYAQRADRAMLLVLADAARGIPSSGDKTEFLRDAAARYLSTRDPALRAAFFDVAATVPSSGDLTSVLHGALAFARPDTAITSAVIRTAARRVSSSGDRADVLLAVISKGLIDTPALRTTMLEAAKTLPSNGDYRRVMEAMFVAGR